MSSAAVLFDVVDGVAVITLNRPAVRNAVDRPTALLVAQALDEFEARPDVRAGVFTGAGPVFCAGMDLKAFSVTGERPVTPTRGAFGIVERPPVKPLIAAVQGRALGGGFEIALACDLIVAEQDSMFGLPEVTRGLVAAAGGVFRLPRRIPRNVATEMLLTGAPIGADRAFQLGLVNRVVATGESVREASALAAVIGRNAPFAVRTAKQLVEMSAQWSDEEAFRSQAKFTEAVRVSADAKEGARAFVEKRAPVWTDS